MQGTDQGYRMLSRSAREATFVFPEGHALPEQTALAFKEWLDKENVSILGCDLGVRSDLAAGKHEQQLYMSSNGSGYHSVDMCV